MATYAGSDIRRAVQEELESQMKQQLLGMQNVVKNLAVQIQDVRFQLEKQALEVAKLAIVDNQECQRLAVEMSKLQSQVEERAAGESLEERAAGESQEQQQAIVEMRKFQSEWKEWAAAESQERRRIASEYETYSTNSNTQLERVEDLRREVTELKRIVSALMASPDKKDTKPELAEEPSPDEDDDTLEASYTLAPSAWDVPAIIGNPKIGCLGSLLVSVIIVLNMLGQILLCCIINDIFTMPEIGKDHVIDMRHWRTFFGHSTRLMNEYTLEPYAKSVCKFVGGSQMGTDAVSLLATIADYYPTKEHHEESNPVVGPIMPYVQSMGVLLSSIAVMIWCMSVVSAILSTRSKVLALLHTPSGEATEIESTGSAFTLVSLSIRQKLFCLLIAAVEMLVNLFLGFSGMFYIIRTLSLRELLLNCSALTIVLELDELVFNSLAPDDTKSLLESLDALPKKPPRSYKGMSEDACFSILALILSVSGAIVGLKNQESILADVRFEICGGNLDFVAGTDSAGVLMAGVDTNPSFEDLESTYTYQAIRQLVRDESGEMVSGWLGQDDMSASSTGIDGSGPWSLLQWTEADLDDTMEYWDSKCMDMLPVGNGAYRYANHFLDIVHDTFEDSSIHDCTYLKQWCNSDDTRGVRARQVCSITCGCNRPGTPLVLTGKIGCSPTCRRSPQYNMSMWSRPCEDLELDSPFWSQYAEGLRRYMELYAGRIEFDPEAEVALFTANGCDVVSKNMQISIVGRSWAHPCESLDGKLKPLTYACPHSCHCTPENPLFLCPRTCG